ncbi:MAG: hypothetical protein F6K19_06260 [Cyanothece sp. SIO1E1]|nr:hypothetical protein [Cyanothece sp. SIO1E1]
METIRKINNELVIAGQVSPEELWQIAREGVKSVCNLRSPEEQGFLNNEQQQVEALGLNYVNIPVKPEAINDAITIQVLIQIDQLPKPVLVHCDSALRAAEMVLMYIATRQGKTLEEAFKRAKKLGMFEVLAPQ